MLLKMPRSVFKRIDSESSSNGWWTYPIVRRNSIFSSLRRGKKKKKSSTLTKFSSVYDWWELQVWNFAEIQSMKCKTFRRKLIQKYTQFYQLATKQQIWGPNTHPSGLSHSLLIPQKSAKSESLLGPKIKYVTSKDLKADEIRLLVHRLSSVRVNVRRWNLFPEELIPQSDFGRQYEPLCYQSPSLALTEWDQKQSLYSGRSCGSFRHFLSL